MSGRQPEDRGRWDRLDAALVTLRTCRSAAELADHGCELVVHGCGADAAALGRVADGVWVPWLRAGRPDLLPEPGPPGTVLLPDARTPEAEAVSSGRTVMGEQGARRFAVAPVFAHDVVAGLLHVVGVDLCVDIVDSYARALGSMFALVGVRRRADEQRHALARLRHSLADGGERPIELFDVAADLRGGRPGAVTDLSSSALRARLTARQCEVLDLMVGGMSNAEIAERLVVALPTVKSHVRAVLRASGAVNRSDAVARFTRG